ncbi:hypothetical protein LJC59_05940 [Desulfovibrio sp. OttesenSCG-928-A18]|nr:hypothetical protein [Desulfovibrio sp. OttesenSCG-928-A18]
MPRQMVAATCEPKKTAPTKFRAAAITMALRMLIALAATGEAMELATSLAPRLKAMRKPHNVAAIRIMTGRSMLSNIPGRAFRPAKREGLW